MKANEIGVKIIRLIDSTINLAVLTVIMLSLAFAGYALWDSKQIHQAADKSQYAVYKPTPENQGKSFKTLQAINEEVFAWLTVHGTNIDYPMTQGQDNMKYVNTNAEGLYSLSGAIFLDYNNSKDFTDFNSLIYGHHMARRAMFGEIGSFADKNFFDSHRYGNLYYAGENHNIEFFAFIHTDAYNHSVFRANVKGEERQAYLDNLLEIAMHKREDVGVTIQDRIVLLCTCSSSSTNGRDILVGRFTDEVYEEGQEQEIAAVDNLSATQGRNILIPVHLQTLVLKFILVLFVIIRTGTRIARQRKQVAA